MSTIAPTLDAASPKRRAISPPSLKTSVEPNGPFFARRSFDVDRRGPGRGDDERDYEASPGHVLRVRESGDDTRLVIIGPRFFTEFRVSIVIRFVRRSEFNNFE